MGTNAANLKSLSLQSLTILCVIGLILSGLAMGQSEIDPETAKAKTPKQSSKPRTGREYDPSVPPVTLTKVRYGSHPRHTLDFWQAESDEPTALVFVVHGGGWRGGSSQEKLHKIVDTARLLENRISVVSIHYRLMKHARDVQPPVKGAVPRDTHKSEAIAPSLTLLVFEHFLPSSTLWLSPNCSASAARADRGAF